MAFRPQSHGREPLAEINMIPLIDVMLVLLVVFMVAAPMLTHAVKIDLPKAASTPDTFKPDAIVLAIKSDGTFEWNGDRVSGDALENRMRAAGAHEPAPELHLYADAKTPYEDMARVMAMASRAGLGRIGFVSDPATGSAPSGRP